MASRLKRIPRELRQRVPYLRPVERSRQCDACPDAPLVRSRTRRIVAAETHAPDTDARGVELATRRDPVAARRSSALVVAADRDLVLGLALAGTVDREHRNPARQERLR